MPIRSAHVHSPGQLGFLLLIKGVTLWVVLMFGESRGGPRILLWVTLAFLVVGAGLVILDSGRAGPRRQGGER